VSNDPSSEIASATDLAALSELQAVARQTREAMSKRIVGQKDIVDQLLIALFADGHALFVGVPGLAKTLLVKTLADSLGLDFHRVQFTPDLMPSDVTGTDVLDHDPGTGHRTFRFVPGPIFTNILLADEINRTPPKTQSALLQAMQERQVTASGATRPLPRPFHVFATQNPIEQEGTYPLPEAQLDRFMLMVEVPYPSQEDEIAIVQRTTGSEEPNPTPVLDRETLCRFQNLVRRVPAPTNVVELAVRMVRATRPREALDVVLRATPRVDQYVDFGAGPRASQHLILAAKARAALEGRPAVAREDVLALAIPVLAHRMVTNFEAEADGVRSKDLAQEIVQSLRGDA
jgi:MoxR-like ATPase